VRGGKAAKGHKIYPYLLRGLRVDRPNQVWCADITYLPMQRGFLYLVAIMDWYKVRLCALNGLRHTLRLSFFCDNRFHKRFDLSFDRNASSSNMHWCREGPCFILNQLVNERAADGCTVEHLAKR
jgi:hypothetical protein